MSRPWDGLVPEKDIRALEERGNPLDRPTRYGDRPCLVVVDLTRTFTRREYAANCCDTGGVEATAATHEVLGAARSAGIPIFFTKVLQTTPGRFLPVELGRSVKQLSELLDTPVGLPDGNEVDETLGPLPGEVVIAKPKPSGFFGTALDTYLNYFRADCLILTGMVTSGCVRATVIDGYMRNYHVIVPEEAVADYSEFQHRASLLDMHAKYADVTPVAEVVEHLRARTREPVAAGA